MNWTGLGILLATVLAAAGCAPQTMRPGGVFDRAAEELQVAATTRKQPDAADKSLMPPLSVPMPEAAPEPRFDLSVIDAPARQVFMAIVSGTRHNMLLGPEVSGNLTLNLKDVTVKETLEAIRELYGYEFEIKGNRITIQPNTVQTRIFKVNYLATRRQGATELRVTSSAITGSGASTTAAGATPAPAGTGTGTAAAGTLTSRVQTSSDADFWQNLTAALGALVGSGAGRNVVVNSLSGVIVVTALPKEMRLVENYLKATQVVVDRQVMLEAKIIDVQLSQDYQAVINWAAFSRSRSRLTAGVAQPGTILRTQPGDPVSGIPAGTVEATNRTDEIFTSDVTAIPGRSGLLAAAAAGKGFIGLAFQTANFAALLNFLETQGTVSVLSSPRIATVNNQKAVLKVGVDELFVTNVTTTTTSTTSGSVSTPSLTLQPYFSGISLDVMPQIDGDDNIILHIHPAVSTVAEKEKTIDLGSTLGTFKLPLASSSVSETDTIVRVKDGNIVAIGGLMSQFQSSDRNQLPGSGGMPLLGQRANSQSKRELVILLKPTIIRDDPSWVRDLEQTGERLRGLDPRQFDPPPQ